MNAIPLSMRRETPADFRAVEELTREAFWNHHGPGCDEHYLAHSLRKADCFLPELSIVAESGGTLVGHILYTKSRIIMDRGGELPVITFGPISVLPAMQNKGIGGALIRHSLSLAKEMGFTAVLILGHPGYYSRQGFRPAEDFDIGIDKEHYHGALQAYELIDGALANASGYAAFDPAYDCDPEKSAAFEQTFPPKEKLTGLPSQLEFQKSLQLSSPRQPKG